MSDAALAWFACSQLSRPNGHAHSRHLRRLRRPPLPACSQTEGTQRMSKLVDMGQGLIDSPSAPGYYRVAASFDEVMAECGGLSPLALGLKQQVAATRARRHH